MVLPADINLVTITGTYLDENGLPETGSVTFVPSVETIRDPTNDSVIKLSQHRVVLDSAGSFSIALIATDDPDIVPVGWYYTVVEIIGRHDQRSWILQVSYTLISLDIADAAETTDPSTPVYPSSISAVTSVVGQVGDVTGAEILADSSVSAALALKADTDDMTAALALKADDSDLLALVPYVGAITDVNLGTNSLTSENVNVNEGTIDDPTIVDLGGLAISISSVDCLIRSDANYGDDGHLYRVTVPAVASIAVVDDSVNHVYVEWNAGSPRYIVSTSRGALNLSDNLPVARLYVTGGVVDSLLFFGFMGRSAGIRWLLRSVRITDPVGGVRESGLVLSESATRVVNIGSGSAWFVLKHITYDAIAQGGVGVVSKLMYHVAGVWTSATITQYNNTQYDNGTNLATLTANRYAVNWVYRNMDNDEIIIVLGNGDYQAQDAFASEQPVIPSYMNEFHLLCGRIIVQKNAATAAAIETVTTEGFGTTSVVEHNDLSGLYGSSPYNHLSDAELASVGTISSKADSVSVVPYTGATTDVELGTYSLYADNTSVTEGTISDPTVTDASGVAISITSVDVMIRSSTTWSGDGRLYRKTVAANTSLAVTDNALNYIYVTWNSGTPIYAATTDRSLLNQSTNIPVARVAMESGNSEYQISYGYLANGAVVRNIDRIMRIRGIGGIERESGFGLSESGTRIVTVASGYAWFGLSRISLATITQGGSGVTSEMWYHSAGVWTRTTITAYNNTQYDNGTNLATLTSNRYAVNWIYRNIVTSEIDIVLGTGDYTLAQAEASNRPAVPDVINGFYVLCGRIIVQKNAAIATTIENAVNTTFNQAAVSNHEDLSGLQGGTTGEHNHLTNAQLAALGTATTLTAGTPVSGGAGTAGQVLYDATRLYIYTTAWQYINLTTL